MINNNDKKILIVTCDMRSHCYASAKLAKLYAMHGHQVTLAGPSNAMDLVCAESGGVPNLECKAVGYTTTEKQMNERKITSPFLFSHIIEGFLNPFPTPRVVTEYLIETQETMYEPIRQLLQEKDFDVIIPMHSTITTVADAAESVRQEHKIIMFSSLPYEASLLLPAGTAWQYPRSFTNFPHVATYSANKSWNPFINLIHSFWKIIDVWITDYMWKRSTELINIQRQRRNLKPMPYSYRGYCQRFPVISVGGLPPFLDESTPIADNVTVVGNLEAPDAVQVPVEGSLRAWLNDSASEIVYVGFGTGTELNETEAVSVTKGLIDRLEERTDELRVLFALRTSEQERLRPFFDNAFNEKSTRNDEGYIEYAGGRIRIQNAVPQSGLLRSGRVKVFVSHMGMGGFIESAQAGVPLVCCPSGCDQYYNAARANDAGIGLISSSRGLTDVGDLVVDVLDDPSMKQKSEKLACDLLSFDGNKRAIEALNQVKQRRSAMLMPRAAISVATAA